MKKILLTLLFFLTFFSVKSQNLMNLKPTGYVNDYEKIFTPEQKDTLEKMLSDYEKLTSIEICLVTSADFEFDYYDDELAEKWGVGKEGLDNGLFITFSKTQRSYSIRTGYGLEAFLPDAKLNPFKPDLRNSLAAEDYFGGFKELILKVQNELGTDGYDMLVKNKEIKDAKQREEMKAFFNNALKVVLVLLLLGGIGFLIYLYVKKRKEFLKLKTEIQKNLNNIESLKNTLGILPANIQRIYDSKISKLTNKFVKEETRASMQIIYNYLFEYKQIINRTESTIGSIKKFKSDIEKYLKDNYPYCAEYLKNELNNLLNDKKVDEFTKGEYTKERMNMLIGIETSLERNVNSFLNKTVKINSIVVDKMNLDKKIEELKVKNSEYIKKKTILSGAVIGKRYNSLVNIDFDDIISKLSEGITESFKNLENGDYESSLTNYSTFVTSLTVLTGAFSAVDSLLSEHDKSMKFIESNKNKISDLVSDIEAKINKAGVSYNQKSTFAEVKNDITRFKIAIKDDIIYAATLLEKILKSLNKVFDKVKKEISSHNSSSSSSSSYSSSYGTYGGSSHSSGGGFGGFGGGSFGGGGVRGGF